MARTMTTQAIVLRATAYRDHHRILTLFSPQYGQLTAAAHGALGTKSKLRAASVPYASGEYVLSGASERLSVVSFAPDAQYYGAMTDYDAIVHAGVLGAFCQCVILPDQGAPGLYALLLEALAYLNFGDYPARTVLCAYLLRMLDEAGFAPEIQRCMCCGAQRGWPMLEFESGGLCCRKCRPNACALPRGGPAFLRQVRQGQIGVLTAQDAAQLAEALLKYAQDALGQPLRAAALLDTAGPTNS